MLEYQGGWLTMPERAPDRHTYELGYERFGYEGLYAQLSWAADQLNRGYYQWRAGWAGSYILSDGIAVATPSHAQHFHFAAGRRQQTFKNLYRRGLARAVRSKHAKALAFLDLQIDAPHRLHRRFAVIRFH